MNNRRLHKVLGSVLLLPFFAWSITGFFFLVRPAYEAAYAPLLVKTTPMDTAVPLTVDPAWMEYRRISTVLGEHLLVRTREGWQHLDANTLQIWPRPADAQLSQLIQDAMDTNPERYGDIILVDNQTFQTTTQAELTLNWFQLSISQQGNDTRWINQIYDIHYLRWTGIGWLDTIVGTFGLILLLLMTVSGALMLFKSFRN